MTQNQKSGRPSNELKRCYNCGVELPTDTRLCSNCKKKVGKRDKMGRARAPLDWKAYSICAVSWFIFGFFIWWGFFRKS